MKVDFAIGSSSKRGVTSEFGDDEKGLELPAEEGSRARRLVEGFALQIQGRHRICAWVQPAAKIIVSVSRVDMT